MGEHFHVMYPGENGGGRFGGRVIADLPAALVAFTETAPHLRPSLTVERCRAMFARGQAVRLREGDDWGGAPLRYLAQCEGDGVTC